MSSKKLIWSLILILGLFHSSICAEEESPNTRFLTYPLDGDQYAIVVIYQNDAGMDTAKKLSLEEAGKVAIKNGYRYFSVLKEENVYVVSTDTPSDFSERFSDNMYYEIFQSREYDFNEYQRNTFPTKMYPAYRLIIQLSKETQGKTSLDACEYAECPKS